MSFPLPPENWDPNDEYGRAQINEFLLAVYGALQRERERVNELIANAGIVRPSPFVGHPGFPAKTECIVFGEPLPPSGGGLTRVSRLNAFNLNDVTFQLVTWTAAVTDDDGIFVNGSTNLVVSVAGVYTIAGHVRFSPFATFFRQVQVRVNGFVVIRTIVGATPVAFEATVVPFVGVVFLAVGDIVTLEVFHNSGTPSLAIGGAALAQDLVLSMYRSFAGVAAGTSQCYDISFSGVPGSLAVPGTLFPVFGVLHDVFWAEDGFEGRGNGDVVVLLGSAGVTAAPAGPPISILFTFAIPRGFKGWAPNAVVFRYGVHFEGAAEDVVVQLVVIDTRNNDATVPVDGFSEFTHLEAGGIVDAPYGQELVITREQLGALAGFREGTGIRIAFSLSVPTTHNVGATVTFGHLELNYA